MENDIKQHTMVFDKGITSCPSDLLCDDDSLEVCDGMTQVDGEWKAIQRPVDTELAITGKLMYVHRGEGYTNYISAEDITPSPVPAQKLYINENTTSFATVNGLLSITAIGNTLIVNTSYGLNYYLWTFTDDGYKSLGSELPFPEVDLALDNLDTRVKSANLENDGSVEYDSTAGTFKIVKASDADTLISGLYYKAKAKVDEDNCFYNPFFAVYAVELYDGSYTLISQPMLMLPRTKYGAYLEPFNEEIYLYMHNSKIMYYIREGIDEEWSDIIKGISLFVSNGIELYKTTETKDKDDTLTKLTTIHEGVLGGSCMHYVKTNTSAHGHGNDKFAPYSNRETSDIVDDITATSVFYKIADLGTKTMLGDIFLNVPIKEHAVENLTTQTQLDKIDYYSHCSLTAKGIATFNRRLNLFNCQRSFFKGFKSFLPYNSADYTTGDTSRGYRVTVTIKTAQGEKDVKYQYNSKQLYYSGMWFYYPDPRASHVKIEYVYNSSTILDANLKEHKGLNGAYYFGAFPDGSESLSANTTTESYIPPSSEIINDYVLQSDVDNPFVINASGYVKVGQGEIIGLAGLTTALSQDAYKVATTIAFTTQGIWALSIDSTGQYAQVAPPFSREVCTNADSITMTDNAVFFVSKKGLMCVTGTNEASVVCVSEALKDMAGFRKLIDSDGTVLLDNSGNTIIDEQTTLIDSDGTKLAYDYRAGLLFLLNTDDGQASWVYNIKTNTWSTIKSVFADDDLTAYQTVVSDYPDTLVQDKSNNIYSFYNKPHRYADNDDYDGTMESRTMKFEGSLILKSIRQIKHLKTLNHGTFSFAMYGKNKMSDEWHQLSSLRGKAWRFFKFAYTFENISASDSFVGTAVITQTRHTDKLR